ncbi:hypothetical protein DFH11DRAFT_1745965 [Phellopilus nigrolimitatus]|nr:hypothetical protein DFH11DRAFT_1745965 [Phellopilus nigrolimitatus]
MTDAVGQIFERVINLYEFRSELFGKDDSRWTRVVGWLPNDMSVNKLQNSDSTPPARSTKLSDVSYLRRLKSREIESSLLEVRLDEWLRRVNMLIGLDVELKELAQKVIKCGNDADPGSVFPIWSLPKKKAARLPLFPCCTLVKWLSVEIEVENSRLKEMACENHHQLYSDLQRMQ